LADHNHGLGKPWDIFWKFLINDTFIMLQKNAFGQKKILNLMQGFKSAILPKVKNCKNDLKHSFEAL
jgi:hypothetical protein